jgi:hypothetical protein
MFYAKQWQEGNFERSCVVLTFYTKEERVKYKLNCGNGNRVEIIPAKDAYKLQNDGYRTVGVRFTGNSLDYVTF